MAEQVGSPPIPASWYVRFLPTLAILVPAGLSVLAWLGPVSHSGLTGYFHRAPVNPWGIALVVAWFGGIVAIAQMGYSRGRSRGSLRSFARVPVDTVHRWTCAVGLFGTAWAYWVASGGSVSRVVDLWQTQQFNALREGFAYGVGVPTLRYAAIFAGALTIARLASRGRPRLVDGLSLIGLAAMALLASRLAVAAAVFIAATFLLARGRLRRPRLIPAAVAALAAVILLTALNYSRNAATYREAGIDNPITMAAINAQSYLAAPTQVTLGLSTMTMNGEFAPRAGGFESMAVLLPTYAQRSTLQYGDAQSLSSVVEISPSLTTNGALPDLLFRDGWWALLAAGIAVGVAGWAAGRLFLSSGIGPAIAGVLLYGMAELWRIFLFNQGILHFLVLIGLAALAIGKFRQPLTPGAGS